jgi:hypothetical protein
VYNDEWEDCIQENEVFVSYDSDKDKTLYEYIIGQAKLVDSPFDVSDHALQEAAPQRYWEVKARAIIARADPFIMRLGPKTRSASGVEKKFGMAKDLAKTEFQIVGNRDGSRNWAQPDAGAT